ncbi:MAG: TetR/AcrR family transcriptional regulator [Brevundimonas sp.]
MNPIHAPVRDADITRATILRAGMDLFAQDGFEMVSVRLIGAQAGVDPSLINRYFGGKEELFVEVIKACDRSWRGLWGDHEHFAGRVARELLHRSGDSEILRGVRIMLRSAGSERARQLIDQTVESSMFSDLENWVQGADADIRARLLLALVAGMAFAENVSGDFELPEARTEALGCHLTRVIDGLVQPERSETHVESAPQDLD